VTGAASAVGGAISSFASSATSAFNATLSSFQSAFSSIQGQIQEVQAELQRTEQLLNSIQAQMAQAQQQAAAFAQQVQAQWANLPKAVAGVDPFAAFQAAGQAVGGAVSSAGGWFNSHAGQIKSVAQGVGTACGLASLIAVADVVTVPCMLVANGVALAADADLAAHGEQGWDVVGMDVLGIGASVMGAGALGSASELTSAPEAAGAARVFWSGSAEARQAAMDWATAHGGQTLEMTARARELAASNLEWTEAKPLWEAASREFAQGASGDVHVFQAAEGVRLKSIWAKIEYPSLSRNPAVNLIYHVVGGE